MQGRWPLKIDTFKTAQMRLLLAHGAGATMDSEFMQALAQALVKQNIEVVRFEFEYMAQRRKGGAKRPPPRVPLLIDEWGQFCKALTAEHPCKGLPTWYGGKSMGGRVASMAALTPQSMAAGLVCFGYPFHPVKKPQTLRIDHLSQVPVSSLIVQGERDSFGTKAEVSAYNLGGVKVHWLTSADHDFKPLKSSGLTQSDLISDAAKAVAQFSSP